MADLHDLRDIGAITRPERPAFLLVSSARFGYGHLARSLKIARALVQRAPVTAYVVSPQPGFETRREDPHIERVGLPAFELRRNGPPRRWPITDVVSTLAGVPAGRLRVHQGRLLAALVRRLRPVGVLLDHYPFLLEEAFYRDALATLRETSPGALTCAGFRGVASRRYARRECAELRRLLERHVSLVLVYADGRERALVLRRYPFLRGVNTPLQFAGYVCPPAARVGRRPPRVLATFGSGVDAGAAVELVCAAFGILAGRRPRLTLDVVTGGRFPAGLFAQVAHRYAHHARVRIIRFLPELGARMARYALVIGRGGYNTLTELYQSGTRGIILPRVYPGNDEQRLLARHFRAHGGVNYVVDETTCRAPRLARLMQAALERPSPVRRWLDTGGAHRAAEAIAGELRRRRLLDP